MKTRVGTALVELLVAMGIMAIILPALITAFFSSRGGKVQDQQRLEAAGTVREAREVLRVIRDSGWANISTNGTYRPVVNGTGWSLQSIPPGSPESIDPLFSLTRKIELGDAYRDSGGNLTTVASGNTLDPSVKRVIITAAWGNIIPATIVSDYFLMRFENLTWMQTTLVDFTLGTQAGTAITNTSGGEVILGSGGVGNADWCAPNLTLSQVDLPKNGVANAVSATAAAPSAPGKVIAGTGDNASGVSLGNVHVTDTTPPTANLNGTFDGYKTNGVYVLGRYAFMGTDTNSKEVVIVDLNSLNVSTGKYSEAGYFNPSGAGNGTGVYALGTLGFVTVGSKLYIFDISSPNPSASVAQRGVVDLSGIGGRVVVNGNYAYVTESTGSRALEIIQFNSDGTSPAVVGWASLSGQNGVDIVVNSSATRAYLVTNTGRMNILNISSKSGALPTPIGVYNTNGMIPKGVAVVTNNKAIVVGTGGTLQYQVVDIEVESNPILCTHGGTTSGGLAIASGINGIASVQEEDGDTYSYIITGDANAELKIIKGGSGGGGGVYAMDGTFDSQIFDATRSAVFNRFDVTMTTPVDTTLEYQIAITNPVSGSCVGASYTFVGPDKTSSTRFTGSSQIPLGTAVGYTNPGQCFRFRAYLHTSNQNNTATLYDFALNYSP